MNNDNKLLKIVLAISVLLGVLFGVLWALRKLWLVILLGGLALRIL